MMRHARAIISRRSARVVLGGLGLAGAVLAFGVFAQAPGKGSDRGAEQLLRNMGGDVGQDLDPMIPAPGKDLTPDFGALERERQDAKGNVIRNRKQDQVATAGDKNRPERDRVRKDKGTTQKKKEDQKPVAVAEERALPGFPTNLDPTPNPGFTHDAPSFYRGIYLTNEVIRIPSMYEPWLKAAHDAGLNTLVIDVQLVGKDHKAIERLPPEAFMKLAKSYGFYMVARVVCFQGGLETYPPSMALLDSVLRTAENAARMGFMEVQLDYIRFADNRNLGYVTLNQRYRMIAGILRMATDRLRPYGIRVGADVFGRIVFNNDDIIGQKVELFSQHLDTLYPMLYPSHFYGELDRRKYPYKTIYEGVKASRARSGNTRIVAYIQGFPMRVHESGLSLNDYIKDQIKASEDCGGDGFIVWHAANQYGPFFAAYAAYQKEKAARLASGK